MPLAPGVRLGVYEILSPLGAGGMGEVYRAHDTKLGRDVALKILPDAFATDPERLARFQREAQVLASLNHPQIAAIYGLEESDGIRALVLELVEGPTLADRIAQGAMPLDEALPIAKQIAEALEAAHEQGVIHRDLKPANIKVRPDGTVKVLDFGLAKLAEAPGASGAVGLSQSPTITTPAMMTGVGTILGTAAYMSPEQAKGRPADKRSDVWAFGVVLYEMVTGRRPFRGETTTEMLASVLKTEPEWDRVPREVDRFLHLSLSKDPKQRLHDIADARLLLDDVPARREPPARARLTRLFWPGVAGVLLLVVAALGFVHFREAPPVAEPVRFTIPLSGKVTLQLSNAFAISPDGRKVVFAARDSGGSRLWIRTLDSLQAHPLPEAEVINPGALIWSPDSL